jgi:hypothetical protein
MSKVVETGTDVAQLVVFDPAVLPDAYDRQSTQQTEILRALHDAERVFCFETGSDGGYLFHVFVDEPIPEYLEPFLREPRTRSNFDAPSGRIFFSGSEYAFRSDDSRLRKHPHMGGHIEVSPGRYSLTMFRTEYPDEMMEDELRRKVDPRAFRLHQNMGCFIGMALLAAVVAIGTLFLLGTSVMSLFAVSVAGLFVAVPFIIPQLPTYRKTDRIWQDIQRQYPSLVAKFQVDGKV